MARKILTNEKQTRIICFLNPRKHQDEVFFRHRNRFYNRHSKFLFAETLQDIHVSDATLRAICFLEPVVESDVTLRRLFSANSERSIRKQEGVLILFETFGCAGQGGIPVLLREDMKRVDCEQQIKPGFFVASISVLIGEIVPVLLVHHVELDGSLDVLDDGRRREFLPLGDRLFEIGKREVDFRRLPLDSRRGYGRILVGFRLETCQIRIEGFVLFLLGQRRFRGDLGVLLDGALAEEMREEDGVLAESRSELEKFERTLNLSILGGGDLGNVARKNGKDGMRVSILGRKFDEKFLELFRGHVTCEMKKTMNRIYF